MTRSRHVVENFPSIRPLGIARPTLVVFLRFVVLPEVHIRDIQMGASVLLLVSRVFSRTVPLDSLHVLLGALGDVHVMSASRHMATNELSQPCCDVQHELG